MQKYQPKPGEEGYVLLHLENIPEELTLMRKKHVPSHMVPSDPDDPFVQESPIPHITLVGNIHVKGALAQSGLQWPRLVADVTEQLDSTPAVDSRIRVNEADVFVAALVSSKDVGPAHACVVLLVEPGEALRRQRGLLLSRLPTYVLYDDWRPHVTLTYVKAEHCEHADALAAEINSYLQTHDVFLNGKTWEVSCLAHQ